MALLAKVPRAVSRAMWVLAALCVALAVLASVDPQWIEDTVGLSPDGGSGGAEWGLVIACAVAALALGLGALSATRARIRLARPVTSHD